MRCHADEGAAMNANPNLPSVAGVLFRVSDQYPGYAFGDDGSVWTCRLKGPKPRFGSYWRQMKLQVNRSRRLRYQQVCVRSVNDRRRRYRFVHHLILEVFIGPRPEGTEGCHNNGNGLDNRPANLRWDTPTGNNGDKVIHGTNLRGSQMKQAKLTEEAVAQLRVDWAAGTKWSELVSKYGASERTLQRACFGKTWRHVGSNCK